MLALWHAFLSGVLHYKQLSREIVKMSLVDKELNVTGVVVCIAC